MCPFHPVSWLMVIFSWANTPPTQAENFDNPAWCDSHITKKVSQPNLCYLLANDMPSVLLQMLKFWANTQSCYSESTSKSTKRVLFLG